MTELEITKLAAEAMGLDVRVGPLQGTVMRCWIKIGNVEHEYWPLYNDAQAMALVKNFELLLHPFEPPIAERGTWWVASDTSNAEGHDLNRAICECVANMQLAKAKP